MATVPDKFDDGILERHGVACRNSGTDSHNNVTIWEHGDCIHLGGSGHDRRLTQWQARYLASKLYRLSRRIRARGQ